MKSINSPLAWFEIVTQDFDRAIQFYQAAFNIRFECHEDEHIKHAIFPYIEGYTGGSLVHSKYYNDHQAGAGTVIIYLQTSSVSKQLKIIEQLGGEIVFPLTDIGENGYIAGFKDSEGNYVGLWSENP
ncbi:VOC family protein [Orbus wheelerorum]|uniref:VOC family protein n=1 Tax=Orbus wheelerorum TaxID=3074111 RepID=UPI00370D77B8